jgi:hypothetical protein
MVMYFSERNAAALPFIALAFPLLADDVEKITDRSS